MTRMDPDELVADARRKAKLFFESLPEDANEQGTLDTLAKLLLDEGASVMRMAADQFALVVMEIHTREGRAPEGRELLRKIHAVLTGGKT